MYCVLTYVDVIGGHSTQQVKSEGDTVQAVDAADTEIFTKLSTHQLSEKGAYILCIMYIYPYKYVVKLTTYVYVYVHTTLYIHTYVFLHIQACMYVTM